MRALPLRAGYVACAIAVGCSEPATTTSSASSHGSTQTEDLSDASTVVSLDGGEPLGSFATFQLATSEQPDGSAKQTLGYFATFAEPDLGVVLSLGPVTTARGRATLQQGAESTVWVHGTTYVMLTGSIDYTTEPGRGEVRLVGVGAASDGATRSVELHIQGELWRPCYYLGQDPRQPSAIGPNGERVPQSIFDEAWASEFCRKQLAP